MIAKTRFCVKYGAKYLGSRKHMVGWNRDATKPTVLLHPLWASSNSFPSPFSVSPHRWMWPLSNQPCVLPKRKSQDMLVRMVGIFLASVGGSKQRACWCHRLRSTNNKLIESERNPDKILQDTFYLAGARGQLPSVFLTIRPSKNAASKLFVS